MTERVQALDTYALCAQELVSAETATRIAAYCAAEGFIKQERDAAALAANVVTPEVFASAVEAVHSQVATPTVTAGQKLIDRHDLDRYEQKCALRSGFFFLAYLRVVSISSYFCICTLPHALDADFFRA